MAATDSCKLLHPCTQMHERAAAAVCAAVRSHLDGLFKALPLCQATSVAADGRRMPLLLRDAFVAGFADADRAFAKRWARTRAFHSHTEAVLGQAA